MASIIKADTLQSTTANVFVLNSSGTEYARFNSTGVFQLTNPTTFPAGTAALPSITATGDTNTGLYFPAADTIGFVEGGVEAMRIDSSGNVGIGTSSPEAILTVSKSSAGGEGGYLYLDNPSASTVNSKAGIKFSTSSGGSFASTPTGEITNVITDASTAASALTFGTFNGSSSGERMRIDSSGNLLVGTTSTTPNPGIAFQPVGNITVGNSAASTGFEFHTFRRSATQIGSITQNGTTAVAYNTSSDYRLKENIVPMTGALATVSALKPVTYKWKADGSNGQGFIAHELQAVVPDCVSGAKDAVDADGNPKYQGIDTSFLVATLTAAIQELKAIVDAQGAEIAALKAK